MAGTSLKGWKVLPVVLVGVMDVCGSWHGREAMPPSSCSPTFPSLWVEAALPGAVLKYLMLLSSPVFFNTFGFPSRKSTFCLGQGGKHRARSSKSPLKEWVWAGAETSSFLFHQESSQASPFSRGKLPIRIL